MADGRSFCLQTLHALFCCLCFLRFDDGEEEDDERYTLVGDGVEEAEEEETGDEDEEADGGERDEIGPGECVALGGVAGAASFSSCCSFL